MSLEKQNLEPSETENGEELADNRRHFMKLVGAALVGATITTTTPGCKKLRRLIERAMRGRRRRRSWGRKKGDRSKCKSKSKSKCKSKGKCKSKSKCKSKDACKDDSLGLKGKSKCKSKSKCRSKDKCKGKHSCKK